jgi:hypothetical protein
MDWGFDCSRGRLFATTIMIINSLLKEINGTGRGEDVVKDKIELVPLPLLTRHQPGSA